MSSFGFRAALLSSIAITWCLLILGCNSPRAVMSPPPNNAEGSQLYDVVLAKRGGSQKKIGQVAVDKEFRLTIISAIPSQKDFLSETFDVMNAKTELHAEAAPPQSAPQFADFSRVVNRNSPEFFPQLQTHLRQYYDLILQRAAR
jgi:hypothetical protein